MAHERPDAARHLLLVGDEDRADPLVQALVGTGYRVTVRPVSIARSIVAGLRFDAIVARGSAGVKAKGSLVVDSLDSLPVEAILQRLRAALAASRTPVTTVLGVGCGDVWFDTETLDLRVGDLPAPLTPIEGRLLRTLALNPFVPLCRTVLRPGAPARAVDISIMRLRRRLEPHPNAPVFLRTVRNRGYMLTPEQLVHPDW